MDDRFYPCSKRESREEDELLKRKESHRANVVCAQDIDNLIASHTRDGHLEPDCAKTALDWWGFRRVRFVLANTLGGCGPQGFEPESLRWATLPNIPPNMANGEFAVQARGPLLAEFLRQTYAEYQALDLFGPEHCVENQENQLDYKKKVLVLRADVMKETCWNPRGQLWYAHCGFGCSPGSSDSAVYATCLGDGEMVCWERSDFAGVLEEQFLPDWAEERLAELRGPWYEQQDGPSMGGMEMR